MLWNNVGGIVVSDRALKNVPENMPWTGVVRSEKRFAGIVEMLE